jgi:DNA-binding XRE family transcriptional regulator
MRAYKETYLSQTSDTFGSMMDYATGDCKLDGDVFLKMFITSGMAEQFERGNPKFIAGKSAVDVALEVIRKVSATGGVPEANAPDYRTPEYWGGWALAQYQWFTGKKFASILRVVSFAEIVRMYPTLHEADISKFFSVIDGRFEGLETNLKRLRAAAGMSQAKLAKEADVSIRSIQMYEQRKKDINKAQAMSLAKIAHTLGCDIEDLLDHYFPS